MSTYFFIYERKWKFLKKGKKYVDKEVVKWYPIRACVFHTADN